ncbi:MAG: helix-turn-helix domain-containing protein, partial [Candidatus Sericytochromatia bacterium]
MATREIMAGPVAGYAAANLIRLRTLRGLTVRALSDRLTKTGRPLQPTAISKIEQGDRRVDVDDLSALALALKVNPSALLLPSHAGNEPIPLTSHVSAPGWAVWSWADGDEPLPTRPDEPDPIYGENTDPYNTDDEREDFQRVARPADLRRRQQHPLVKTTAALLGRVTRLAMLADDSDLEGHETRMRGARAAW